MLNFAKHPTNEPRASSAQGCAFDFAQGRLCLMLYSWLLIVVLLLTSCSRVETPRSTPTPVRLRLAADDATHPLLQALTEAYSGINPNVFFSIESGNPEQVAQQAYTGAADLVALAGNPPPSRNAVVPWLGDLASDGVAIVVSQQNPMNGLTLQDVRDIFAGVRGEWSDFGIPDRAVIEVTVREEGDGGRLVFDQVVMGKIPLSPSAIVLPNIETVVNYVSSRPDAIGYLPTSRITGTAQTVLKAIAIDGLSPAPENIVNGTYRLSRNLRLLAAREPQGEARRFVAWALSGAGRRIAPDGRGS